MAGLRFCYVATILATERVPRSISRQFPSAHHSAGGDATQQVSVAIYRGLPELRECRGDVVSNESANRGGHERRDLAGAGGASTVVTIASAVARCPKAMLPSRTTKLGAALASLAISARSMCRGRCDPVN